MEQPAPWCREDRRALIRALREGDPGDPAAAEAFRQCWRAVTGRQADDLLDPEARVLRKEERRLLGYALRFLPLPGGAPWRSFTGCSTSGRRPMMASR